MYKGNMRAMPVVPIEVLPYIRGIQLVLSSYEGYTKGKRREADKMIRDEIKRAGTRARNHIANIHDIAFKTDRLTIAKIAKLATTEIDTLIEDVDKSVTGMNHAFFSGSRSAKVSDLKKLIKHDHDVIEMVTKAINIANSAEHAFNTSKSDQDVTNLIQQCQQMITSCQGFFNSRSKILGGLRQKAK
tara:strand:- start:4089 stop:4649 length:561 start_codon:yes stop_codon:yes gene_type:complete